MCLVFQMLAWPECHLEKEDQAMEDVLDKEKVTPYFLSAVP